MKKTMKKTGILFATVITMLVLIFTTTSVSFADDVKNPLAIQDEDLIEAGAERYWAYFRYDYKYENLTFSLNADKTVTVYQCDAKPNETVTIPAEIAGHKVKLSNPEGDEVFSSAKKIIVSEGIEYIDWYTFSGCKNLEEVVLHEGLKTIGGSAFSDCPRLEKVNIPGSVEELGSDLFYETPISKNQDNYRNGAFYWDHCLIDVDEFEAEKFVVEKGTRKIASNAFDWTYTNEIILPDSLETISSQIGSYGGSIEKINIPENVSYIGEEFFECRNIYNIEVSPENRYFCVENNALLSKDKKRFIRCALPNDEDIYGSTYYIPDGVEVIEGFAFDSIDLQEVVIPSSVAELKMYAFARTYIKKITLPETVKKIGSHTFELSYFRRIEIKCKMDTVPYGMFRCCYELEEVLLPEGIKIIEGRAFDECKKLTEITLPSTLERIITSQPSSNGVLFEYCYNLKTVRVAEGNKHFTVVDGILYDKNMTAVYFCPSGYEKKTVTLPSTVRQIMPGAFWGCKNITTVEIPEGIEYIKWMTFYGCENLSNVIIPNTVKCLEAGCFMGCTKLNLIIPESVEAIYSYALGYTLDYEAIDDYKIYGYTGSVAERYAVDNSFGFVSEGIAEKRNKKSLREIISGELKYLPCKSAMVEDVIFLLGNAYMDDVFELSYLPVMFRLVDCFDAFENDIVGTGSKLDVTFLDEWEFDSYYFVRFGDTNGDGNVDQEDIKIAENYIGENVGERDYSMMAVDFDGDGKITSQDVQNLKDIVNGKITEDEVCHIYEKLPVPTTTVHTHTAVVIPAVSATYTKDCLTEGKKCSSCGEILEEQKKVSRKKLNKVTSLKVKSAKTTSVKLSWKKVEGAESYKVYYSTKGKKWKSVKVTKNSVTVKKLTSGKNYQFKVKAVAGKYEGSASSVVKTATKVSAPAVKSVKSSKAKQAVVTWNKVNGADGYVIEYSTSKKFTKKTTKSVTVKKGKTVKTTLKKLKSGKKYYVRIKAYKTVNKKAIYGAYSKFKTVKAK